MQAFFSPDKYITYCYIYLLYYLSAVAGYNRNALGITRNRRRIYGLRAPQATLEPVPGSCRTTGKRSQRDHQHSPARLSGTNLAVRCGHARSGADIHSRSKRWPASAKSTSATRLTVSRNSACQRKPCSRFCCRCTGHKTPFAGRSPVGGAWGAITRLQVIANRQATGGATRRRQGFVPPPFRYGQHLARSPGAP